MMRPARAFVCRPDGADRVVLMVPIGVVPGVQPRSGKRVTAPLGGERCRLSGRYGVRMQAGTPGVDRPIEVIIADDHAVVRDGIRTVLEREADDFHVVDEDADVPATLR